MQGDIDMAKFRLLRLPLPGSLQEPFRVTDYLSDIAPYLYNEGARVYHTAAQTLATGVGVYLAFNSERWDTDTIHDPIANNSRLTCKTAGKYIISASVRFDANAVSVRGLSIRLNGVSFIAGLIINAASAGETDMTVSTIWDLAVGNYLEVKAIQFSGGNLNVPATIYFSPEFMMQRIGA